MVVFSFMACRFVYVFLFPLSMKRWRYGVICLHVVMYGRAGWLCTSESVGLWLRDDEY